MVEATQTLQRAQARVQQVRARALATEELLATGALSDFSGSSDAELDRQITEVARAATVDTQLAAMKRDVLASGAGPKAKALPE